METELSKAVDTLRKALAEDKSEGSYYFSWQANIAMSLLDELKPANFEYDSLHEVANKAAKRFLDILIGTPEPLTKIVKVNSVIPSLQRIKGFLNEKHKEFIEIINEEMNRELNPK